jgi:hypothetical protein
MAASLMLKALGSGMIHLGTYARFLLRLLYIQREDRRQKAEDRRQKAEARRRDVPANSAEQCQLPKLEA